MKFNNFFTRKFSLLSFPGYISCFFLLISCIKDSFLVFQTPNSCLFKILWKTTMVRAIMSSFRCFEHWRIRSLWSLLIVRVVQHYVSFMFLNLKLVLCSKDYYNIIGANWLMHAVHHCWQASRFLADPHPTYINPNISTHLPNL